MKHAFLIIAHGEFQLLKVLLSMLDDERNDIYLHIDKKTDITDLDQNLFALQKARFFLLEQRIDTRWGDLSLIKVEMLLLKTACKKGPYDYYHLLSGVDLPIKSQDYIHSFFEKNNGYEFVSYSQGEANQRDLEWKVLKYHLFSRYFKIEPIIFKKLVKSFRKKFLKMQEKYNYCRAREIEFKKGSNWVSITHHLVTILLQQEPFILKRFKYVSCGDEIFLHSILWNSERRNHIFPGSEGVSSDVRSIDWDRGEPYTWRMEDLPSLLETNNLFARKFSSNDMGVVKRLQHLFT